MLTENPNLYYLVMVIGTYLVSLIISVFLRKMINVVVKRSSILIKSDPTNFSFLKNAIPFIVFSIATIFIFYKIPFLKSLGAALFAGAGIIAAIVGFASQKAFANIISGIFILIFKPFRVHDTIETSSSNKGVVEEITLRHTVIRDYENRRVIVPNSQISDDVLINSTIGDERIRKFVEFGISYDSDVDLAMAIIQEEAKKHPLFIDSRSREDIRNGIPPVLVKMVGHGDFAIQLRAYVWSSNNDNAFALKTDL
jgi:small conductance mechanosensitive channel